MPVKPKIQVARNLEMNGTTMEVVTGKYMFVT